MNLHTHTHTHTHTNTHAHTCRYKTLGSKSQLAQLHPACSGLKEDSDGLLPEWLVFHELVSTSRPFLRNVSRGGEGDGRRRGGGGGGEEEGEGWGEWFAVVPTCVRER
jgi:hypothetical protein